MRRELEVEVSATSIPAAFESAAWCVTCVRQLRSPHRVQAAVPAHPWIYILPHCASVCGFANFEAGHGQIFTVSQRLVSSCLPSLSMEYDSGILELLRAPKFYRAPKRHTWNIQLCVYNFGIPRLRLFVLRIVLKSPRSRRSISAKLLRYILSTILHYVRDLTRSRASRPFASLCQFLSR